MNITSDVNKNIDLLSSVKNEEQNSSILSSLFSINFEYLSIKLLKFAVSMMTLGNDSCPVQ